MTTSKGVKIFVKNEKLNKYLFILRDDKPDIIEPNMWGLLGGGMKNGESPYTAIKREIAEEINIKVNNIQQIRSKKITHEVQGRVYDVQGYYFIGTTDEDDLSKIVLKEGQRVEFYTLDEIMRKPNLTQSVEDLIGKDYVE